MSKKITVEELNTDVLIIGGGTAGCYGAYILGQKSSYKVLIAEKANIKRSGCLAAGVNAINAYITEGRVPQDYVDYCKSDAKGIVREDLLLSISEGLNEAAKVLEDNGLVILKDENGKYVTRGNRNIKINGENIKPILADLAKKSPNVNVINHLNITDLLVSGNRVYGAVGFDVNVEKAYVIYAKAVLVATGGAAGLYRPNNPGFSRHKMWYPPFNTGAGYAMGINAGAEMTTLEMRFIALRCKDTIAPTGTIAQGVKAKQMNGMGEIYETKYGVATCERVYGTTVENQQGRGPCYLKTDVISEAQEEELYKAYLNMAPSQTLKWIEGGQGPKSQNVEIEGTEPYIVGGHTASGYWVDNDRATTVKGLYAAGDVAGGAPQKYVTGALVEGKLAAEGILKLLDEELPQKINTEYQQIINSYNKHLNNDEANISIEQLEEAMQKIMDEYAGGITKNYQFNDTGLVIAKKLILGLLEVFEKLRAKNTDELLQIFELRDRLIVSLSLIEHLAARKETRWHSFAENMTHPDEDNDYRLYVNSVKKTDGIHIIKRPLVVDDYEPIKFTFDEDNRISFAGGEIL